MASKCAILRNHTDSFDFIPFSVLFSAMDTIKRG